MLLEECENCGSIRSIGTDEFEFQECSACGWRPGTPLYESEYDREMDDDIYD